MVTQGVYGVITLEINTHDFIEQVFKSVENIFDGRKQLGFNYKNKLTIKCTTVNEPKGSSSVMSTG